MTHADLLDSIAAIKRVLADPQRDEFTIKITRGMLEGILYYLYGFDPDMPSPPLCKALGPLVGDTMMNTKLRRLDEIADALGPQVIRLTMIADQLERRT